MSESIERNDQQSIFNKLREPIPAAVIKTRKQGSSNLQYLEWSSVADILDRYAPGWSYEVKEVKEIAKRIIATVAITINGVRRENTGIEDLDMKGYGDPVSNAVAMAFKRAAAMFGVGRDLYQDHSVPDILEAAEAQKEKTESERHATLKAIKMVADTKGLTPAQVDAYITKNKLGTKLSDLPNNKLENVLNWVKAQSATAKAPAPVTTPATVQPIASVAPAADPQAPIPAQQPDSKEFLIKSINAILPEAHTQPEKLLTAIKEKFNKSVLADLTTDELNQVLRGYREKARQCRERKEMINALLKEEAQITGKPVDKPDLAALNYVEMGQFLQTTQNRLTFIRQDHEHDAAVAAGQ